MAQKQVGSASVAITKLIDGTNQYIFIRYSKNENGNPMTETAQADTKYMGIYTSTRNEASTDYRDYSWALIKGDEGQSPVSGVLTDEFIAINTDSNGLNGDFSKATTSIMLFEGLVENTKDWNIQVTTTSGVNGTYTTSTATYKVDAMTVDSGAITFTAKKGTTTVVKKATVQKVKSGADGSDGDDGKGIDSTKIEYQKSNSGSSVPGGQWSETMPALSKGDYLWTKTTIQYTDGTFSTSYSVGFIGVDGEDGGKGDDGVGIKTTEIRYQKSTSGTVVPTGTWLENIPVVAPSEYLWTRTLITYTNDKTSTSYAIGRMGEQGPKGDTGDDAQLLYLSSTANIMQFNANNQPVSAQTITVTANLQNITGTASFTAIPYINDTAQSAVALGGSGNVRTLTSAQWNANWTRVVIKATLGSLSDTITIVKLKESKDGIDGEDGLGIKLTVITYQASTSGTTTPTGTWSETVPSVAQNQYLWTRTVITYTDNTTTTAYSVGRMGSDGNKGDTGLGIASTTVEYQASVSGVTIPTGAWSTTIPSVSENQYLWTRTTFKYTDNSAKFAYSVGKMGANGQTTYLHRAWAWNSDGTDRFTTVYPGENLFSVLDWTNKPPLTSTGVPAILFNVKPSTNYTVSTNVPRTNGIYNVFFHLDGESASSVVNGVAVNEPRTITSDSTGKVVIAEREYSLTSGEYWIKLEEGSSATAYTTAPKDDYTNAYPLYQGTYTDFNPIGSTDLTKYTWERSLGQSGEDAVVGLLTNESITLAASTSGVVSDFSKATGSFKVYNGLNDVTSESIFALKSSAGGAFAINSSGVYSMSSMSTDTAQAVFTATYKSVVIEKTLTVSKSKTGASGENSTSYWLVLSSQVLSLPRGATELVPKNFTITPMRQTGSAAAAAFTARIIVDETTDGTNWTNKYNADTANYTYTPSSINVQSVRVQMKLNASSALLDQKSVNIVRDGVNGAPGQDGSSSHTWVRYSKNADGNPMTTIPNKDTKYIGISITSSNYPPSSYSAYTWARIKGDGGLKTKLYTESGANINDQQLEIFNEAQSDGDVVEPEDLIWSVARESSQTWSPLGSHDHPNYAETTSQEWSKPYTAFSGVANTCPVLSNVYLDESWQVGDKILVYLEYKYDNIVAASGQTAKFWTQGAGNVSAWTGGTFGSCPQQTISGSGTIIIKYFFTLNAQHLTNRFWKTQVRHDYVQSGSVQWKLLKVEKSTSGNGDDFTGWTPYLEGTAADIPIYYDYNINLMAGTAIESSMDSDAPTSYSVHYLYKIKEGKTLGELGYKVGDKITTSFKWNIGKIGTTDITYGTARVEWANKTPAYIGGTSVVVATFSASNTNGEVRITKTLNEAMLNAAQLRLRIDNSVLKFTLANVKVEPGDKRTPWVPLLEELDGILVKQNSIVVSPNAFLNENSLSFRSEVYYQTMKAMDQMTITNKAFDAMRPLILRQPVAPRDPYPGLLWMDTSSEDNYIYRWGRTPRQEPNGVKYTHFAYTNSVEDWQDFTVYYPYANEIRNGVNINDTSFWAVNRTTIIATDHNYYPNGKTLRVGNTSVNEGFVYANNKAYRPLKAAGSVYTFGMTGFMNSDCKGVDVFILARPVGSTSQYTLVTTIVAAKMFSSSQAEKLVVNWTVPSTWTGNLEYILRFDNNGSKTEGTLATFYMADVYFREGKQDATAPALPAPEDDSANAFMHFVGTYVDKTEADSLDPNKYNWVTLNNASTYEDNSGNKGVEEEDFVTVYDWGWIVLTPEEKEGIPWLNNEDGSTMIDWIYQITQNTSDSSIINKVVGSEQMKDVYASSDDLNELVGSNKELAAKMEEYNLLMQQYADQINSMYTNMTEMQQTIDKFLFNIESAGGVNIIRNSTGFQYDDETGDFYKWIKWLNKGTVTQEMGNQSLNDLGFVAGFRFNGYQASLKQDLDLPAPDIEYTLSTYISILNNTPGASRIVVKIVDRDNESLVYGRISTDGADIPASDRFSVTFNSPSTKVRIEIALWTDNADTSTTASALVAGTMLNIGPFPLSWQAHHEEVYSTNVRMDGSGLKVFNNDYDGYNVMTPREFAGYYKDGGQYEKVFTLNKDTTEVKKLQAEERFMMKPIQIVSIDSPVTPGWAFVPYDNDDTPSWNPNLLCNITIPQIDSNGVYWPKIRKQTAKPWATGNISQPENSVLRMTAAGGTEVTYRFGSSSINDLGEYSPGKTYTVSLDLRANLLNSAKVSFRCESRNTASWTQLSTFLPINEVSSSKWIRVSYTMTIPLDSIQFYIGLQIYNNDGTYTNIPAGNCFDFKAPKLEIGSIMTL